MQETREKESEESGVPFHILCLAIEENTDLQELLQEKGCNKLMFLSLDLSDVRYETYESMILS